MSFNAVPTRAAERSDLIRQLLSAEPEPSRGPSIDASPVDVHVANLPWSHVEEIQTAQAAARGRSTSKNRDGAAAAARAVFMSPPHSGNPPPLPPFVGHADPYSGRYVGPHPQSSYANGSTSSSSKLQTGGDPNAGPLLASHAQASGKSGRVADDTDTGPVVDRTAVALAEILRDVEQRTNIGMPPPMTSRLEPQHAPVRGGAVQYRHFQQQEERSADHGMQGPSAYASSAATRDADTLLVSLATILGQQLQQQQRDAHVAPSRFPPPLQTPSRPIVVVHGAETRQRDSLSMAAQSTNETAQNMPVARSVRRPAPAAPSQPTIAGAVVTQGGSAWTQLCESVVGTETSQRVRFMTEEEVVRLRYAAAFEESLAAALMLVHARALAMQQQRARARHAAVADSEARLRRHAAGALDVSRSGSSHTHDAVDVSGYDTTAVFSSATPKRHVMGYTPMSHVRAENGSGGDTQPRYFSSYQRTPLEKLAYESSDANKGRPTASSSDKFQLSRPYVDAVAAGDRAVLSKDLYYLPLARGTGTPANTGPPEPSHTALPSPSAKSALEASKASLDSATPPAPLIPPPFTSDVRPGATRTHDVPSRSCTPNEMQSTTAGRDVAPKSRPDSCASASVPAGRAQRPPVHRQPSPLRAPSLETPAHRRPPPVLRQPSPVRRAAPGPPAGPHNSLIASMCWHTSASSSPNPATPLQPPSEVEAAPVVHGARPRVPSLPIMPMAAPPMSQHFPPLVPPETRPPPVPEMRLQTSPTHEVQVEGARRSASPAAHMHTPSPGHAQGHERPPPPPRRSASPASHNHNESAASAGTATATTTMRSGTPTIARPPAPPFPPRTSHPPSEQPLPSAPPAAHAAGGHRPTADGANRSPMRPAPRPEVVAAARRDVIGSAPAASSQAPTSFPRFPPSHPSRHALAMQQMYVAVAEEERHDRIRVVDQREVELVQLYEQCETARLRVEERAARSVAATWSSSLPDQSATIVVPPTIAYPPLADPAVTQRDVISYYPQQPNAVPLTMPLMDATRMPAPAAPGAWRTQRLAAGSAIQLVPRPSNHLTGPQDLHPRAAQPFVATRTPLPTSPDDVDRPLQLSYSRNRH